LLQRCRLAAGLSQEELAERAGLSRRGISDLERGVRRAPHPATLRRLADALDLDQVERADLVLAAHAAAPGAETPAKDAPSWITEQPGQHTQPAAELLGLGSNEHSFATLDSHPGDAATNNLPVQLTSFVGRVQETSDVRAELASTRLLTLAGPGGVGKTRLALHVAEQELSSFQHGVWFVDLEPLREPTLVAQLIAAVLNVHETPGKSITTSLSEALRPLDLLLILDNCEHVLEVCVDLVQNLLRTRPRIHILITSREVLGIGAERVWRVPSLRVPEIQAPEGYDQVARSEAVALFVDRARAVQTDFALDAQNAKEVADLCHRLDGIPLAIELAASRVRVLSVEQISERLKDQFQLLASRDRTMPGRQQTLEATMRWSYQLLGELEQRLFNRLAVFAGGWTLEAAEAVAAGDGIAPAEVLDLLERLVDKSLVIADVDAHGPQRFRLLETLRQFGRERLGEHGENVAVRDRHAEFFLQLAEESELPLLSSADRAWMGRLNSEQDNIRVALRCLIESADTQRAQRLAGAARRFWLFRGGVAEARSWLDEVLALDPADNAHDELGLLEPQSGSDRGPAAGALSQNDVRSLSARAKVLHGIGMLAFTQGDLEVCRASEQRALHLYRVLDDTWGTAWPLQILGAEATERLQFAEAQQFLEQAVEAAQTTNQPAVVAAALSYLADAARELGEPAAAHARAQEALSLAMSVGFSMHVCRACLILGELEHDLGQYERARSLWEGALARARQANQRMVYVVPLLMKLGQLAWESSEFERSRALLVEGLLLANEVSKLAFARSLEAFMEIAIAERQAESGVFLGAAAAALRDGMGAPLWPTERPRFERVLAKARDNLTRGAVDAAWAQGWTATSDQVIGVALDVVRATTAAEAPTVG
jgi:non-specific serine/threonine protein kinase